jgi:ribosome recycling factor
MVDMSDLRRRMEGAIASLQHEFAGLRTGRASVNLLDTVQVDAYGSMTPLTQVASVSAPEARMLSVQVWDKTMVAAVEKGILNANLGLNPSVDGQTVRLPMPELTEERRKELAKLAHQAAENARISIRNIRRDGMDDVKKAQKDGDISEDVMHGKSDDIQKLTDEFIGTIDTSVKAKEEDILKV